MMLRFTDTKREVKERMFFRCIKTKSFHLSAYWIHQQMFPLEWKCFFNVTFKATFKPLQAIQNPGDLALQEKAWNAVCPLVAKLKRFYEFSLRLGEHLSMMKETCRDLASTWKRVVQDTTFVPVEFLSIFYPLSLTQQLGSRCHSNSSAWLSGTERSAFSSPSFW